MRCIGSTTKNHPQSSQNTKSLQLTFLSLQERVDHLPIKVRMLPRTIERAPKRREPNAEKGLRTTHTTLIQRGAQARPRPCIVYCEAPMAKNSMSMIYR